MLREHTGLRLTARRYPRQHQTHDDEAEQCDKGEEQHGEGCEHFVIRLARYAGNHSLVGHGVLASMLPSTRWARRDRQEDGKRQDNRRCPLSHA